MWLLLLYLGWTWPWTPHPGVPQDDELKWSLRVFWHPDNLLQYSSTIYLSQHLGLRVPYKQRSMLKNVGVAENLPKELPLGVSINVYSPNRIKNKGTIYPVHDKQLLIFKKLANNFPFLYRCVKIVACWYDGESPGQWWLDLGPT